MSFENSQTALANGNEALKKQQPMIAGICFSEAVELLANDEPSCELIKAHQGVSRSHILQAARDGEAGLVEPGIAVGDGMVTTPELVLRAVDHASTAAEIAQELLDNKQLSKEAVLAVQAEALTAEALLFEQPPQKTLGRKFLSFLGLAEIGIDDLDKIPKSREEILHGVRIASVELFMKLQMQYESEIRTV